MPRPTRLALAAALLAAALPAAARAGELTVTLRDVQGRPLPDAVVTVELADRKAPARYAQPLRMSQRDQQFSPRLLVVPVGAEVVFANEDRVRHHVYSFSPAKRFELKLFGRDQTHTVRFDKAGVVALGCNIHDNMAAYVKVVDAPFAVVTDAAGRVRFRDLPAGVARVRAWRADLRAPGGELRADVAVPAAGSASRDLAAAVSAPRQ